MQSELTALMNDCNQGNYASLATASSSDALLRLLEMFIVNLADGFVTSEEVRYLDSLPLEKAAAKLAPVSRFSLHWMRTVTGHLGIKNDMALLFLAHWCCVVTHTDLSAKGMTPHYVVERYKENKAAARQSLSVDSVSAFVRPYLCPT